MSFKISLSVHDLVDFVLRSGDIDTRIFNNATMLEGSRIHRYYQQKMNSNYKSEVFLSYECEFNEFFVHIEGRADGLIINEDSIIVDEIKSCVGDLEEFHKRHENWHLGQAKIYAFMYCNAHKINDATIVLTYISQEDNNNVKKYFYSYKFTELETYFFELLFEYLEFEKIVIRHKTEVRKNIKNLQFPFASFNLHQEDLISFIEEVENENNARALVEAPTGIGKTISFLYPSLRNLRKYDRIFYLTAKNSGKEIVDSTIDRIISDDFGLKTVILTAKDKICPQNDAVCNPEACPLAREYYDKLRSVLLDSFYKEKTVYNLEFFKEVQEKYSICPFEFQLDLSMFCDLIVGDYNYIFDPFVYLQRYIENDLSNTLLLVDEGHNLLDRTRNMYSTSFGVESINKAKKSLKHLQNNTVKNNLNKIKKYLEEITENVDDNGILEVEFFDEKFVKMLSKFHELYTSLSAKDSKLITKEYKDLFNQVNRFLKLCELIYEENFYVKYFKIIPNDITANIYCTLPTKYINQTTKRFKNSLIFSATLSPFKYYNELLFAGDETTLSAEFDSPFDSERLNISISNNISIKYKDRTSTIFKVVSQIAAFISVKKGNYFIFVPSYEYLNLLKNNLFIENVNFIYQEKEMKEQDKRNFINVFKNKSSNTNVGVCVLGGSFSESINLIGESLIGVIIIGVGMPAISFENNAVKNYYDFVNLDGFYYAYIIPGMKNVIQSVGRLIRTSSDYGSVLLIDERYKQPNYRKLFRKEWKNLKIIKNDYEIIENLNIFYKKILNQ